MHSEQRERQGQGKQPRALWKKTVGKRNLKRATSCSETGSKKKGVKKRPDFWRDQREWRPARKTPRRVGVQKRKKSQSAKRQHGKGKKGERERKRPQAGQALQHPKRKTGANAIQPKWGRKSEKTEKRWAPPAKAGQEIWHPCSNKKKNNTEKGPGRDREDLVGMDLAHFWES